MAEVRLHNVKKIYPVLPDRWKKKSQKKKPGNGDVRPNLQITEEGVVAVQEFNLDIADGEFIVLVGPSGCGKSTTLRMIAGLEEITSGELYIAGEYMNDVASKDRDIAMVFQNYALYPHMTVYENMAFSLNLKKLPLDMIDRKVKEAAAILDITQYLDRYPKSLSGGQRQRVAIGRAIVRSPKVLLMDEPLSNLDAQLRNQMRAEMIKLRNRIASTFVYVTHDQTEAMTLGDRIVIMKDGFIQQIGTPQEVFHHPSNLFVAGFIGTPQMNFFRGSFRQEQGGVLLTIQGKDYVLPREQQSAVERWDTLPNEVTVGVRPQHIYLEENGIPGTIEVSEMMGSELYLHVRSAEEELIIVVPTSQASEDLLREETTEICYSFHPSSLHFFDVQSGKNLFYDSAGNNGPPAADTCKDEGNLVNCKKEQSTESERRETGTQQESGEDQF